MDLYQGAMPYTAETSFKINEAGTYTIQYIKSNITTPPLNIKQLATISKYNNTNGNSNCDGLSPIPFNQIIDLGTNGGSWLIPSENRVFHQDFNNQELDVNGKMEVFLTPGCYQMNIANPDPTKHTSLRVFRIETTINSPEELESQVRAGIRVRDIKDYTKLNTLSKSRKFSYRENISTGASTGNMVFNPTFYYIVNGITFGSDCQYDETTTLYITASSNGGNRPHVAYDTVFESVVDANNNNNGYSKHEFNVNNAVGIYSSGIPPNVSSYSNLPSAGKEITNSLYDNSLKVLSKSETEYGPSYYNHYSGFGIYLVNMPNRDYDLLYSRPYGDKYTYGFLRWTLGSFSVGELDSDGNPVSVCGFSEPDISGFNNYQRLYPGTVDSNSVSFDMRLNYISGKIGSPVSQTSTQYFGTPLNPTVVSKQQTFTYDNEIGYLIRSKSTIMDGEETIVENYLYPQDKTGEIVYDAMVNSNQLVIPVETETTVGEVVQKQVTNYIDKGNGFFPQSISISKNLLASPQQQPLEKRIHYEYNTAGNVVMTYQLSSTESNDGLDALEMKNVVSYIWGYDNQYPIVKAVNAPYALISSFVNDISSKSDIDNDRMEGYNGAEGDLRQAIQNLRNDPSLSNALITSYTYDPLIGMTSQTSPNGYTMYYDYDTEHRLKHVKDSDGNILSENEYNYRTNN